MLVRSRATRIHVGGSERLSQSHLVLAVTVWVCIPTATRALTNATVPCSGTFDSDAWVDFGRALKQRETEVVAMHAHVDDRVLAEMSTEDRLDRLGRILEALEARGEPRFSFVDHEHKQGLSNTR